MPLKAPQAEDCRLVVRNPFCNWQHWHVLELAVDVRNSEIELMKNALIIVGSLLSVYALSLMPIDRNSQDSTYFTDVSNTHLQGGAVGNTMDGQAIDIDNDGDLDMILAMEFQTNKILINNGSGQLVDESKSRFPSDVHDSEDIAIADFDGDGDLDIVFVSEDDQVNEFYENQGNARFKAVEVLKEFKGTSNAVETADFNGDGSPDLLIGNAGQNYLLINDGTGGFRDEGIERLGRNSHTTQDVELADVDNDGDLDILEGNEAQNRILINNGRGFFTDETSQRLPRVTDQTRELDAGDIDNDGDVDLFFSNVDFGGFGDPQNRSLLNDGKGYFKEATDLLPQSNFRTVDTDFVDLNKDGFLDLLVGNRFNGNEHMAWINQSGQKFTDQTSQFFSGMNMYPFDFQSADFNGDGIMDLFICGFRGPDKLLFGKQ